MVVTERRKLSKKSLLFSFYFISCFPNKIPDCSQRIRRMPHSLSSQFRRPPKLKMMSRLLLVVLALFAISDVQVALARLVGNHHHVSSRTAGHSKVLRKAAHHHHKRRRLEEAFGGIHIVERVGRPEFWEKMKSIEVTGILAGSDGAKKEKNGSG